MLCGYEEMTLESPVNSFCDIYIERYIICTTEILQVFTSLNHRKRVASFINETYRPAVGGILMKWGKIHLDRFWLCAFVIILISFPLILLSCSCDKTETDKESPITFTVGKSNTLISENVGPAGGTINVDKPGNPLNGLTIEIPAGSYESQVSFTISESPILDFKAESEAVFLSPLISIENGGILSKELIKVKVPVTVPEGHFAMAFFYDQETGDFEGIPTVREDDSSLTFVTTHFSSATCLGVPLTFLDALSMDTYFYGGKDAWNLPNYGSYLTPNGYCRGMNLTALYYFKYKKPANFVGLWKDDNGNGLGSGMETPDFWQDDKWAIQYCSAAHTLAADDASFDLMLKRLEQIKGEVKGRTLSIPEENFYQIAFALWVDNEPQLLYVMGTKDGKTVAHSLICRAKDIGFLYVVDPNYPKIWDRVIGFDLFNQDPTFYPYDSPSGDLFDRIGYGGSTYFFDLTELDTLWAEYEAEGTGRYFPQYDILVTEIDENGNEKESYLLQRTDKITTNAKYLKFTLSAPYEGKISVYRFKDRQNPMSPDKVELFPGDNLLGLYVQGQPEGKNTDWEWAGFDWIQVTYEASILSFPTPPAGFVQDYSNSGIEEPKLWARYIRTEKRENWRGDMMDHITGEISISIYRYEDSHEAKDYFVKGDKERRFEVDRLSRIITVDNDTSFITVDTHEPGSFTGSYVVTYEVEENSVYQNFMIFIRVQAMGEAETKSLHAAMKNVLTNMIDSLRPNP